MNRLTLLVDSNWLTISRMSVLIKGFEKTNPDIVKQQTSLEFKELMARSINVILNRFPEIDNIILVSDGGSWRKQLPIPKQLNDITYKGNRGEQKELDWDYIWGALSELLKNCKDLGITCTQHNSIEGDDWIWYWSRRLNSQGTHCMIWSSDNDLKQLVQLDKDTNAFTVWYNDKNGLFLPSSLNKPFDDLEFFMRPEYISHTLESLKRKSKTVDYVDPNDIILSKIFCGDSGDNIKSVVRYIKGTRTYRFTEKDFNILSNDLNIGTIDDLLNNYSNCSEYISSLDKYKDYDISSENVNEMLIYNTKLVWLNESVIPEPIIQAMNQENYNEYDISYLRSNFKILIGEDDNIKNIFESL